MDTQACVRACRLAQEATNNEPCVPDAKMLACIADAAFDMDDLWRIAKVLHQRLSRAADWKEWRPVYKALVVLEFLLTHGPEDLPREFLADVRAMHDLRSFHYVDDKGFDWGACMQRRTDSVLSLLTDADRLREARRRVSHEVHGGGGGFGSPTSSSSPSSASSSASSRRTSRTWSFGGGSHYSDSPTMCLTCAPDADYRHDKKCDAYTADDDCWAASSNYKSGSRWAATVDEGDGEDQQQHQGLMDDAWDAHSVKDSTSGTWSARLLGSLSLSTSRASGFQSLSQPEQRRTTKKLQGQLQCQVSADYSRP
jgi:epsin